MFLCPHCNKPGITLIRKLFLGPALPATCKSCHKKVGVPYLSTFLACTPIIIAIFVYDYFDTFLLKGIILLSAYIIMTIITIKWVPLIPK